MMPDVRRFAALLGLLGILAPPPDVAPPGPADGSAPPEAVAMPIAGPSFDDDGALPAHAQDVADYTMYATLDPEAHTVHGEGTITWRNTSAKSVREVWLHLYLNAFKNERSAFFRERVGGGAARRRRTGAGLTCEGWLSARRGARPLTSGRAPSCGGRRTAARLCRGPT